MLLYGKPVADKIYKEVKKRVTGKEKILIIQVGDNPASNIYVRNKMNKMSSLGISVDLKKYDKGETNAQIYNELLEISDKYTGIFLQLPTGSKSLETGIKEVFIAPSKDVDGLNSLNNAELYSGYAPKEFDKSLIPCTARGVIQMLDFYNIPIEGKTVGIIGRSELVGKPLIHLMLSRNATVISMNSKTEDIQNLSSQCDILVSAVGKANFITKDFVTSKTTLIDVGINFVDGKMCGDAKFDEVEPIVANISPVPKGVGPLTVANLMLNITNTWGDAND